MDSEAWGMTLTLSRGLETSSVLVVISPRLLYDVKAIVMLESAPAMDDWSEMKMLSYRIRFLLFG